MAMSILEFYMGNGENNGNFCNYCSLRLESCLMQTTNRVNEDFLSLTQGHLNVKIKSQCQRSSLKPLG